MKDEPTAYFECAPCETRWAGPRPERLGDPTLYPACWLCGRRAIARVFSPFFTTHTNEYSASLAHAPDYPALADATEAR